MKLTLKIHLTSGDSDDPDTLFAECASLKELDAVASHFGIKLVASTAEGLAAAKVRLDEAKARQLAGKVRKFHGRV